MGQPVIDEAAGMLTPVEPETFKLAVARMCLESSVKLLLHSVVDEVRDDVLLEPRPDPIGARQ